MFNCIRTEIVPIDSENNPIIIVTQDKRFAVLRAAIVLDIGPN